MIEQQNYKQFISEQGGIQTDVAAGWGYKINPHQYVPKPDKVPCRPKIANFQPMKRILDLPISKKMQQIDEELLMLENEKKLAKMTEEAKASLQTAGPEVVRECAAVTMMHQRIQQYNFIVDHRHIIQKNTQRARKILGIKKTKLQLLNESIQALKDKIPGSSFAEVIKINQSIAKHYRTYEKQMLQSKQNTEGSKSLRLTLLEKSVTKTSAVVTNSNSLINSSKLSPGPKTEHKSKNNSRALSMKRSQKLVELKDLVIMQELKQSSQGQSSYFDESVEEVNQLNMMFPQSVMLDLGQCKMKRKVSEYVPRNRLYTVTEKPSAMEEKKQRMSTTITESFVSKVVLDKGKILDRQLRQNQDVIDVWRQRIDQNKQKNEKTHQRFLPKAKTFKKSLKNTSIEMASVEDIAAKQKMQKAKKNLAFRMMQVKMEMNQKQKMLATILRKKQSKFKRVPGTQLVQPNDPHETAQKILGIANHFEGNPRATIYSTKVQHQKRRVSTQADGPEWLIMDEGSEQLYWSMCKNEKLNIRLKHKKN